MELRTKIELKDKKSEATLTNTANLHAQLRWKTSIDLDLHAMYETKSGNFGHILFSHMSGDGLQLDEDAGVGDVGGNNVENININSLENMKHILIIANIYGKKTNFSRFDGVVVVESDKDQLEVPLTSKVEASWCIVAHLDNTNIVGPKLINVNTVHDSKPDLREFLSGNLQEATESNSGGGFFRGILGRRP